MATIAQIAANRENALSSTGPKTEEGKSRTARNAVSQGLFAMKDFVLPEESLEHEQFCDAFWLELGPTGPMQETYATEIVRAAWRLRRCGLVEANLASESAIDPMQNEANFKIQTAVDRARAQANSILRRSHAELRRLKTEQRDVELIPAIASTQNGFAFSNRPAPAQTAEPAATEQSQFVPVESKTSRPGLIATTGSPARNIARRAPCPCGSREKYKRCCGRNAPPLLHQAA